MARSDALLKLHKTLLARRAELRRRLGLELQGLANTEKNAPSGDAADAAFDTSGEEIASQLAELEAKELTQIERALRRLKQGTYGKCEACSAKIPVARLNALPFSTLCIKCQREMESDAGWGRGHGDTDWTRVSDHHDHGLDDREVKLSDLEIDLSK
jgi:DnaK suppressor protein